MTALDLKHLPPAARKKALAQAGRTRRPSKRTFLKDQARSHAIRVLAVVADLSPDQRRQVLVLATRMNAV